MNHYCIKDHLMDSKEVLVLTTMNLKNVKDLIFSIQAKMNIDIIDNLFLDSEDIVNLLVVHYGFIRKSVVDSSKTIEVIDLVQVWNENIEHIYRVYNNSIFNSLSLVEDDLLKSLEKHAETFIFINVAAKLPKWAEEIHLEPLTLQVTHGGVLIQGLSLISEEERNKILSFYPGSTFYDKGNIFFSFKHFPPYQYTFTWNGRHISVKQVKESDQADTEIIKQMNIGYYLNYVDLNLPINNLKELNILKKKMRLL